MERQKIIAFLASILAENQELAGGCCLDKDGPAALDRSAPAITSQKRRRLRPASLYATMLGRQSAIPEEGEEMAPWRCQAKSAGRPGLPPKQPLIRKRPRSVIDGTAVARAEPSHPFRVSPAPPPRLLLWCVWLGRLLPVGTVSSHRV